GHDGDGRVAPLGIDDVIDGAELVRTVGDGERVAFFVEVAVWHAVDVTGELRDALAGLLAAHAGVGDAGGVVGAEREADVGLDADAGHRFAPSFSAPSAIAAQKSSTASYRKRDATSTRAGSSVMRCGTPMPSSLMGKTG